MSRVLRKSNYPGVGNLFSTTVVGGSIDARFMPAILKELWKRWRKVLLPVPMPVISEFVSMMVRCTRLTQ